MDAEAQNDTAARKSEILKLNHQRDAVKLKELEKKYKDELANKEKKNFMSFDQDPDELERFNRAASRSSCCGGAQGAGRSGCQQAQGQRQEGRRSKKTLYTIAFVEDDSLPK